MQLLQKSYTPDKYLELEEKAEFRSEYRNGEIVPIAGGTTNHNQISGNVYANLKFALKGQDYRAYISDVRLWIPPNRQYIYPDVMLIQGEPIYLENTTSTVTNPRLIVEVLSKSTKNYDQGDKFTYYRSIPELQEYILIDQSRYHVMQYVKTNAEQWLLTDYTQAEAIIKLGSIDLALALNDIYDRVNFNEIEE
ncbi:Uma2 family endonuclease [Chamaesiphon sp. VAR_48_metabat_135_sub]|uniref:Uma2 family endonuclease n=1 Tax=Chamaesiphon sp. VAR_48_metabat_135_sub TaxID=2964699 RepID=UPI00286B6D3F|nr:Uma2 family endonuclease [Chamaesiphon sp. VAR_48_metabat_135_sub]